MQIFSCSLTVKTTISNIIIIICIAGLNAGNATADTVSSSCIESLMNNSSYIQRRSFFVKAMIVFSKLDFYISENIVPYFPYRINNKKIKLYVRRKNRQRAELCSTRALWKTLVIWWEMCICGNSLQTFKYSIL